MQLIESVEISYFRSIYKVKIDSLADLNIIFGRNDSGKSNIIRALNLIFNGETNPEQKFDFITDLCHARLDETRSKVDARKFVSVKVVFKTPQNWKNSLGDTFYVKKTWNVTTPDEPSVDSSIKETKRKQFLTRFMNKINFFYIPAIKSRKIFEDLLGKVYTVLSVDDSFHSSLNSFSLEVQKKTEEMSKDILGNIGEKSSISTMADLTSLFRSLDFETIGRHGDKLSLTLQRGDGIQVRHIPSILSFLSKNDKYNFNIWGFEEPENSLELASAMDEAKTFSLYSQREDIQIFVTSHSPAFFLQEGNNTKKFYVEKTLSDKLTKETSSVELISDGDESFSRMGENPYLPLISRTIKEAQNKIIAQEEQIKNVIKEIDRSSVPLIFVEGESDKIIFSKCWDLFSTNKAELLFINGGGTTKMKALFSEGKVIKELSSRQVFAIVDNDKEGRELSNIKEHNKFGKWITGRNGVNFYILKTSKEFTNAMVENKIEDNYWPFSLENCFSINLKKDAESNSKYSLTTKLHDELLSSESLKKIIGDLHNRSEEFRYYIYKTDHDYKIPFAEWICQKADGDPAVLENFKDLIVGLETLIQSEQSGRGGLDDPE
ncbi:MAG: ATP-dependent endonuclease [Campylobacterales bacterium]